MKKQNLIFTVVAACIFFFIGCKKEQFTVTFNPNGGKGTMQSQIFVSGKSQALLPNAFTNKGYTFSGWNTSSNGSGTTYKNQETIKVSGNMVLFAQWGVVDIDGNHYNTVQIGAQCWLKENLKTTKYKTGGTIPLIADNEQWVGLTTGATCYYNNNKDYVAKYGAFYNEYAVQTSNLCPEGWHIPSMNDWYILIGYLGGYNIAGNKMKTTYDWVQNDNGSNESGFSALPAGIRFAPGNYSHLGAGTMFWSSTAHSGLYLFSEIDDIVLHPNTGVSVRCIKD